MAKSEPLKSEQSSELDTAAIAGLAGLVTDIAIRLQHLERRLEMSFGVDDEFVAAIAAMPGVEIRETVYVNETDSFVIKTATIRIGHVVVRAQAHHRPPTSVELEAAGEWYEHVDPAYRAGTLRPVR